MAGVGRRPGRGGRWPGVGGRRGRPGDRGTGRGGSGPARPGRRRLGPDGATRDPAPGALGRGDGGWPRIDPRFARALDPGAPGAGPAPAADPRGRRGGGGGDRPGGRRRCTRPCSCAPRPRLGAGVRSSARGARHHRAVPPAAADRDRHRPGRPPASTRCPAWGRPGSTKPWPATLTIRWSGGRPWPWSPGPCPPRPAGTPATSSPGWATVDATGRVLATVQAAPGLPVLQGLGAVPPRQDSGWRARPGPAGPSTRAARDHGRSSTWTPRPTAPRSPAAPPPRWPSWPLCPPRAEPASQCDGGVRRAAEMAVLPATIAIGPISVDLGDGSQLAPSSRRWRPCSPRPTCPEWRRST